MCFVFHVFNPRAPAEEVPFTEVAPPNDPDPDVINRLKYQAVVNYLKGFLGARYSEFEKLVTPDLADEYVIEFSPGRSATNKAQVEVRGTLNADRLRRWVRMVEAKGKVGTSSNVVFLVSSSVPDLNLNGKDTSQRVRDNATAREMLNLMNALLAKLNFKITTAESKSVSLTQPATSEDDIQTLRDSLPNQSKVIWVDLAPCKPCGGLRLEIYFYNLLQSRALLQQTEEVSLEPRELANASKLAKALKGALRQFQSQLEELVSSGAASSNVYHFAVERVDSYQAYKTVESQVSQLDFVVQLVFSHAEPKVADYEVFSSLSPQEFSRRINATNFHGFRLKPLRVDSRGVFVRYLRTQNG